MNPKATCIIIEDEQPAAELLELYISRLDQLELVASFSTASEALAYLASAKVDLIISDINLPGFSGVSLIRSLADPPAVIFTTAYPQYAVDGFDLEAVDYLLKPIAFDRFLRAINRFFRTRQPVEASPETLAAAAGNPFIFIKSEKKMVKVFLDDIFYCEAQKNYLLVNTAKGQFLTYSSISDMEERLPATKFLRVHRSFIIALDKIDSYTPSYVEINKTNIPIGRHYAQTASQAIQRMR
ncbi:LytTR family DNA-binding domain-containing protein [Flavihumibacter rivuli]|uniref:LytR/AlgR family response regulator transcription factor n=1 Tax=Flavihumibacter rivuli TaxID=2838156 RepID=UPI001BDF26F0|nr:LytTR family DNA-binding domain-containing protein [Flavihumibacter rivuli]ULQ55872.1 LytTR family DNA-binding domain-containing protein [Flavihumibacter rivuli]